MKDFLRFSIKMLPNHNDSVGGLLSQKGDSASSSKEAKTTRKKKNSECALSSMLVLDHGVDSDLSSLFT